MNGSSSEDESLLQDEEDPDTGVEGLVGIWLTEDDCVDIKKGMLSKNKMKKLTVVDENYVSRPKRAAYIIKKNERLVFIVFADECYVDSMMDLEKLQLSKICWSPFLLHNFHHIYNEGGDAEILIAQIFDLLIVQSRKFIYSGIRNLK